MMRAAAMAQADKGLTQDELDILQEVVNIAFGKASSDLAEVVDVFVVMSVPQVTLLKESEVRDFLLKEVGSANASSVVEQHFWGRFKGAALLFFTPEAGVALAYLLNHSDGQPVCDEDMAKARESIIVAGGILAVACVGKIAECLDDMVTYSYPSYSEASHLNEEAVRDEGGAGDNPTVAIKTSFSLDQDGLNGFLMLVAAPEAIGWLKGALNRFMEQYG